MDRIIRGDQLMCSMCDMVLDYNDTYFFPALCYRLYGVNAHKICNNCWWTRFALEGGNHPCPGCIRGIPIFIDKRVVYID